MQSNSPVKKPESNIASNMTSSLNIISAPSLLAAGQPVTLAAEQTEFKSARVAKPAFPNWRLIWGITTLFEVCAGIFVVFYLIAAVALAGALLFYTFTR
jgi:hypothetical protein